MEPTRTLARRLWEALEPLHATVYFAPEPAEAATALGLKGWWMGYFAGRFAPLGAVGPEAATAMAFGFHPARVARALPDAWRLADPADVLLVRTDAVSVALRRGLPGEERAFEELRSLLGEAVAACRFEGRALAAAWSAVSTVGDPVADAWLATSVLREHRGDGHVLAAVGLGLRGLDATLTHVATGNVTRELLQVSRGWSDEEWEQSRRRLQSRGLLDRDGRLTKTGGALRKELEETTDRLAAAPVEALGQTGVERVIALAAPLSRRLVDSGEIPVPNPIGAPRP